MKKVAVILSGCGVYDGAEIHESCAALLALERARATALICAPSGPQLHVIDHLAGEPVEGATRDIRRESARIARGAIPDLADVPVDELDAVLLPGGFGAAKNLCDFAVAGADCRVHDTVATFLQAAHAGGKPIGAMCIAPVILARLFGSHEAPLLTIGNDPATAAAIEAMGAKHVACAVADHVVDEQKKIVTTPAYMLAENIAEVFDGATGFVGKLLELCS
jgi:enhancing lycopene biosynthesis protein 2